MPNPNWTYEYNTGQSPEANSFSRQLSGAPVVTEVTSGNPSFRRVEIDSNNGDAIFLTSQVPSLDPLVGATAEALLSCSGAGDAGFEMTFLDAAVLLVAYQDSAEVSWPSGGGIPGDSITVATPSNDGDTRFRFLFKADRTIEVYREGVLIIGPQLVSTVVKPFQRVLWWGEGGGVQTFKEMSFYIGGAVAPG